MPPFPRFVLWATVVFWISGATMIAFDGALGGDVSWPSVIVWVWVVLASIGSIRGVRWGQAMMTTSHVVVAVILCLGVVPDIDQRAEDLSRVQSVLVGLPVWVGLLIISAASFVVLLPPVVFGRRKSWYRKSWW